MGSIIARGNIAPLRTRVHLVLTCSVVKLLRERHIRVRAEDMVVPTWCPQANALRSKHQVTRRVSIIANNNFDIIL